MIDTLKGRHEEKATIRRIKKTIPIDKTIPLRIDAKTVIYISKEDDPEKKKAEFISKLERYRNNNNN